MKKRLSIILLFALFLVCNTSIAAKDIGQNLSKGKVKSIYNEAEKTLDVYGSNTSGNLGNGTKKNVSEANKIRVNEKIGNRKIIDYFIDENVSYILTEDNNIYLTGKSVGDALTSNRTTFIKASLHLNSKIKKTSIAGKSAADKKRGSHSIIIYTKNKKIYYEYSSGFNDYVKIPSTKTTSHKQNLSSSKVKSTSNTSKSVDSINSIMYVNKTKKNNHFYICLQYNGYFASKTQEKKNGTWQIEYNKKGKIVKKYYDGSSEKYDISKSYEYVNGKLREADSSYTTHNQYGNSYSYSTSYDKNGKVQYKGSFKWLSTKDGYYEVWNKHYFYNKGVLYEREIYKNAKNKNNSEKMYLYSVKEYKKTQKGKKYYYTTFYNKKNKAIKTVYYQTNKKGKVINKKIVKTR